MLSFHVIALAKVLNEQNNIKSLFITSRVSDFEFTPECIVFDLLSIGLYHGWLVDPQNAEMLSAVGGLSYNQLVEKIIASKQDGAESQVVSEGNVLKINVDDDILICILHKVKICAAMLQLKHFCH